MLIAIPDASGTFKVFDQTANGRVEVIGVPSQREKIVEILTSKGYSLIDVYDALSLVDPELKEKRGAFMEKMKKVDRP